MSTYEIDSQDFDEQLVRAVEADARTPVATRAAMRQRQGLGDDDQLSPADRTVWTEAHIAACKKSHEQCDRLVRVGVLLVLLAIYFGWLA